MATLQVRLQDLAVRVATECKTLRTLLNGNAADNTALLTTVKTNIVAALNEVVGRLEDVEGAVGGATGIDDDNVSAATTYSSQKIEALIDAVEAEVADKAEIDDTQTSTSTTYSSQKIAAEIAARTDINDAGVASSTDETYSIAKIIAEINSAKAAVKDEILGGAGAAYDTLAELQALFENTDGELSDIMTALGNRVRTDTDAQGLTLTQQANARKNIDAYGSVELGNPDTDLAGAFTAALI